VPLAFADAADPEEPEEPELPEDVLDPDDPELPADVLDPDESAEEELDPEALPESPPDPLDSGLFPAAAPELLPLERESVL
jgi:hypothetical protein